MKQVANGLSYITEDFEIAKFIINEHFPKSFTHESIEQTSESKITSSAVSTHFLSHYKNLYQDMLKCAYYELL